MSKPKMSRYLKNRTGKSDKREGVFYQQASESKEQNNIYIYVLAACVLVYFMIVK